MKPAVALAVILVAAILSRAAAAAPGAAAGVEPLGCGVCVVGGGSAGIGAAMAAARAGADVILVERNRMLGGTSTSGYVCRWEPGPGCAFAREIFERLRRQGAAGITSKRFTRFGALLTLEAELAYEHTLRRGTDLHGGKTHAVVFEPGRFHETVSNLLAQTRKCRVMLRTSFTDAKTVSRRVDSIGVTAADGTERVVRAKVFIDCTGGGHVCRKAGCEAMIGEDSRRRFGEAHAPVKPSGNVNAVSLCYRVTKAVRTEGGDLPPSANAGGWRKIAGVHSLPGGDRIVNPLPLMEGIEFVEMGYAKAYEVCRLRAGAHWRWLRQFPEFEGYRFHSFAPMLGIRESHRVVTEYILTENDILGGLAKQEHDDIIAVADHPMDIHGKGGGARRVRCYGVPYRCLVPKGYRNLLVAGRGAGFSHLAASSCRLSRTMMALGHAAGLAAAEAALTGKDVSDIRVACLVHAMGACADRSEEADGK